MVGRVARAKKIIKTKGFAWREETHNLGKWPATEKPMREKREDPKNTPLASKQKKRQGRVYKDLLNDREVLSRTTAKKRKGQIVEEQRVFGDLKEGRSLG